MTRTEIDNKLFTLEYEGNYPINDIDNIIDYLQDKIEILESKQKPNQDAEIKKLKASLEKKGLRIKQLVNDSKMKTPNHYNRLIDRLRKSERELLDAEVLYQEEIKELKQEISELLELISK